MFYVVIIQNNDTPAIFAYNSYDAALAKFHTEMAYRHESRTSTKCMIIDGELLTINRETYTAPVQTVEEPQEG